MHHVTTDNEEMLGHVMSSKGTGDFSCTTRYSELSEIGDDKTVDVMCDDGEVMTDCSMVTKVNKLNLTQNKIIHHLHCYISRFSGCFYKNKHDSFKFCVTVVRYNFILI